MDRCSFFGLVAFFLNIATTFGHEKDRNDLFLLSKAGQKYFTDGSKCPFGSYFYKGPEEIDCLCSKGLWLFYSESCGYPTFMQGSEEMACTAIDFKIKKSLLISTTLQSSLSILHPRDGISMKLFENSFDVPFKLIENELIVTSGEWTLEFETEYELNIGRKDHFCLYESSELMGETIESVLNGNYTAKGRSKIVNFKPFLCAKFLEGSNPESQNCGKARSRRYATSDESYYNRQSRHIAATRNSKGGRAFLPTMLAMNEKFAEQYNKTQNMNGSDPNANGTNIDNGTFPVADEDLENITRDGNIIIKSQIWNYLTEKATDIMGLLEVDQKQSRTRIPAFRFLELCKDILAKRCPEHYVTKAHLDLSVAVFRAVQLRDMLYEEPTITHEQVERIIKSLQICKEKTNETFPFVQVNVSCNFSDPQPPGALVTENPLDTVGRFYMFEQELYMDVPWGMSPQSREPIIDTVWNIYLHAHSHCFEHFNESSFNDHHKFSTIMMSMFTNGILDIWTEITELNPSIYSGFLGDAVVLMQRIVHCAASGRIQNGTTYPWDLQRPVKINATDPNAAGGASAGAGTAPGSGAGAGAGASGKRKKRTAPQPIFDANPQAYVGCITNIQENSFICHE